MGVLALVEHFVREDGVRSVLQIAVVVIEFTLMAFWNRRNLVVELDECRRHGPVGRGRVVSTAPSAELVQEGSDSGSRRMPETAGRARR